METIADRIKFARKKIARLTQEELTQKCGWEYQSRVSSYERGEREPSSDDIKVLAEAMGVSRGWLAANEGDPLVTQSHALGSLEASKLIHKIQQLDQGSGLPAWAYGAIQLILDGITGAPYATPTQPSLAAVNLPPRNDNAPYVRKALQEHQAEFLEEERALQEQERSEKGKSNAKPKERQS